jgi:aconitate hydratase
MPADDPFNARKSLSTAGGPIDYFDLNALSEAGVGHVEQLPFSIKVLLESMLRHIDGFTVTRQQVEQLAGWQADAAEQREIPFMPGRVVLQDFTGVPAVVDLAALRDAAKRLGADPKRINPLVRCDLVIDHSVQVDHFAREDALELNLLVEFERNRERYEFLKWGQQAFENFAVVPPGTGIIHQVNLEYLAKGVLVRDGVAMPDSLVGTDSHTTMINGLGVVGWGVGGIEAEAVMLGQPIYMLTPQVVGFKLTGRLPEGATATDLVLTVTQMLRDMGVVGQFVEFYGPGMASMSLPDRATIANMAPEYGATMGFFPIDQVTLDYMKMTGRSDETVDLVERYCKAQGLWRSEETEPKFTRYAELDLSTVEPCLAGPKRPQDRINLSAMAEQWRQDLSVTFNKTSGSADSNASRWLGEGGESAAVAAGEPALAEVDAEQGVPVQINGRRFFLQHGDVVIAAVTSCTNTSNPSVMLAAGLLARNAVERGLTVKPWVKTSMAPGSRVVTDYYEKAGLWEPLRKLGFDLVGYGCTTCIGNSGPLPEAIAEAVDEGDLVVASVLSGNRNFEGRINPHVKANYLASPPLVVAYALAGTVDIDLTNDPIGTDADGNPVTLSELWPSQQDIRQAIEQSVSPGQFTDRYADVETGDDRWQSIDVRGGELYDWQDESTYIQHPPFFATMDMAVKPIESIDGAHVLAMFGDSVTTDHISPAGAIKRDSPAGRYLQSHGVEPGQFNSFGSRRGNHEVMMRGTFGNIRVRNLLAPGTEGGLTTYLGEGPDYGEVMSIYDAAMKYAESNAPLVVLAGKDYGMGSSRDWAAKGTQLLGVRAVIAESFERIHRSNLVGMGVLPLCFAEGENRESLGLTGQEIISIDLDDNLKPGQMLTVTTTHPGTGEQNQFAAQCRIDTPVEIDYYRNGGILHTVLRKIVGEGG